MHEGRSCVDARHPFSPVTPTVDGDVLSVLAVVDAAFTAPQVHRLLSPGLASLSGVRKALTRLADQGTVTTERLGGTQIGYRFNREHLAAEAIISLATTRERLLQRFRDTLATWAVRPAFGAIFGSWARREAGTASDLDIFLVAPGDIDDDVWAGQVADLERAATAWTGNDARAFVLTESEVREDPSEPVLASIISEGIPIAGNPQWLRQAVRKAAAI